MIPDEQNIRSKKKHQPEFRDAHFVQETGHYALSKSCPARAPAQAEDGEEQAVQDGAPGPDEGAVTPGSLQVVQEAESDREDTCLDDSVLDVEDLLGNSSDEDLF
jgi:hypothetical protein